MIREIEGVPTGSVCDRKCFEATIARDGKSWGEVNAHEVRYVRNVRDWEIRVIGISPEWGDRY